MTTATTYRPSLAELDADPYPVYARLRRDQPVCWLPWLGQWLVTRWPDVNRVLVDADTFTSDIPGSPMIRLCGGPPLAAREGSDHRDIREALVHDYAPHRVTDHVDTIVRPIAEDLAGSLFRTGPVELVGEYFEPVAMLSDAAIIGLQPIDVPRLRRWGTALLAGLTNFAGDPVTDAEALAAMSDLDDVLLPAVRRLRTRPDESLIAHLVHAHREAGAGRADEDVVPVLKQFAFTHFHAGWLAGWTVRALWEHPAQLDQVRGNRWLVGAAVNEALRWSTHLSTVSRRTTRPVRLGGTSLPTDALLAVSIASANRDELVFPRADEFDLHRDVRTHLGLGAGRHQCPAFAFVPAVARTCLDVLFDRFPGLRPAPGWRPAPHGWRFRFPGPISAVEGPG